jgi:thioredoxin
MTVIDIPDDHIFASALGSTSELVVVDYYATWCGPCKMMKPVLEQLSIAYPKSRFLAVNIDEVGSLAKKANVTSLPTMVAYKRGVEVDRLVGADKNGLIKMVEQWC